MKYFNFIAAILLAILYSIGKIPPSERYNLWFTIFVIPIAMVLNTVFLIVALIMRKKSALYYIIPMIIGVPYILGTIAVKRYFKSNDGRIDITVLNYNVSHLHVKPGLEDRDGARLAMKKFMLNPSTDIQCYQEFAAFKPGKGFNFADDLAKQGRYYYLSLDLEAAPGWWVWPGTLIVSKFPIVGKGDVLISSNGFNRVTYADVKVGEDTVRIINVHLESMGLGRFDPRYMSHLSEVKDATVTILSKLKTGVFERSKQVQKVASFVESSPYPVICVGDFNDMPYSYSYQYLKKRMRNSFEESGQGLGFTYNGETLRMLRIDNQFYTGGLKSIDLKTRTDINFTDHFPLEGAYQIMHDR